MSCPSPEYPLYHMLWCTATSVLLSLSAFGPSGVAKMLKVFGTGGCVIGPTVGSPMRLGAVMGLPKRLSRFEHTASHVVVTSGC